LFVIPVTGILDRIFIRCDYGKPCGLTWTLNSRSLYVKVVAVLNSSHSQSIPIRRGRPKQSDDDAAKSRTRTPPYPPQKRTRSGKALGPKRKWWRARTPRDTPGLLPTLSTKGSNSGHHISGRGTANAHVKTESRFAAEPWRAGARLAASSAAGAPVLGERERLRRSWTAQRTPARRPRSVKNEAVYPQ
jgi:hypothetical protein